MSETRQRQNPWVKMQEARASLPKPEKPSERSSSREAFVQDTSRTLASRFPTIADFIEREYGAAGSPSERVRELEKVKVSEKSAELLERANESLVKLGDLADKQNDAIRDIITEVKQIGGNQRSGGNRNRNQNRSRSRPRGKR